MILPEKMHKFCSLFFATTLLFLSYALFSVEDKQEVNIKVDPNCLHLMKSVGSQGSLKQKIRLDNNAKLFFIKDYTSVLCGIQIDKFKENETTNSLYEVGPPDDPMSKFIVTGWYFTSEDGKEVLKPKLVQKKDTIKG